MTTCELYAKIIAASELLQPALNEIHKFCFQHWSRGRGVPAGPAPAPLIYPPRSDTMATQAHASY